MKNTIKLSITVLLLLLVSLASASAATYLNKDYNHVDFLGSRFYTADTSFAYRQAAHAYLPPNTAIVYDAQAPTYDTPKCAYSKSSKDEQILQAHGIFTPRNSKKYSYNNPYYHHHHHTTQISACDVVVDPHTKPYFYRAIFIDKNGDVFPTPYYPFYSHPVVDEFGKVQVGLGELVIPPNTPPVPLQFEDDKRSNRQQHSYSTHLITGSYEPRINSLRYGHNNAEPYNQYRYPYIQSYPFRYGGTYRNY